MQLNRRRSRAGSLGDFGLPNGGRQRSRSFINTIGASSPGSDSESSSLVTSHNASPSETPESTPRVLPPGVVESQSNAVLARLAWDQRLCAAVLEDDLGDRPLAALTKVLKEAGTALPLIRDQVQLEFVHNATEKDAILRGNCVATRVMSAFCGLVGQRWVVRSLRSTVKRLAREPGPWALDAAKLPPGAGPERLEADQHSLVRAATAFLQKLRKAMAATPRELRCMAYFVWIQARTFCPERASVLLGGFVFLRVLNPALVAPEQTAGLLPEDAAPGPGFKQNCIALCRLLQNLSNNKLYPEAAGVPLLNAWLQENREPLEGYLLDLATDPDIEDGRRPFADLTAAAERPEKARLLDVLAPDEWEALHVALVKCKTHVIVRSTLAPVLQGGTPKKTLSPRSSAASVPASPSRSRSGSCRFRGEEEQELAIYNDGKMRMRSTGRRGSLSASNGVFSHVSQPNLSVNLRSSSPAAGSSPPKSPASGPMPRPPLVPAFTRAHSGSFSASPSPSSLSPRASLAGSPVRIMASHRARSRTSSSVGLSPSSAPGSPAPSAAPTGVSPTSERAFFALLETLPLPEPVRLERFVESLASLQRPILVHEGLLSEGGRRASIKLVSSQVEQLLRLAVALRHPDFGMTVDSFTLPMLTEWCAKWIQVDQSKDVDHLAALMVRNGFLAEKGSKTNRGYALVLSHIAEMSRLLLNTR